MLRSSAVFQLTALPYELLASAAPWERSCAQMASELPAGERRVLDLGCGPGNCTAYLGPGAFGGDHALAMLRRARRRSPRLPLVCLDAGALPLRDGAVDAVTLHSVLYLLPERALALREIARVLRSGGRALLLEPQQGFAATLLGLARALATPRWALTAALWHTMGRAYGSFTAPALWSALETAGLRVLRIEETLGGLGLLAVAEKP